MVPPGARSRGAAAGLGAAPDGGDEEVDGSAGQERAGLLGAAAPHEQRGGEDGALAARRRARLHQPAQQGERLPHNTTTAGDTRRWKQKKKFVTKS